MKNTTDIGIFLAFTIILMVVSIFGGHFTFGAPGYLGNTAIVANTSAPGLLGVLSWLWNGVAWYFMMMFFQVPNMPIFIGAVFWVISAVYALVFFKLVRGTGGTS